PLLARRFHPGGSGLLQPAPQPGQWRGQPGWPRQQPLQQPWGRGADPGSPCQQPASAAEAQPDCHPAALPGHTALPGRGRDGPQPAGQQQRLLPGQPDQLGQLAVAAGG
ncbi:hypothetical protein, partial [Providencia heimbachae]|uniref:hypothetical protein n=1 Tax=Providencia heimbachae TaxID=333962 RepID=UPI003905DE5F